MKEEWQVLKIPAVSPIGKIAEEKKQLLRVAAYCRVSTELEQQAGSYARQIAYYQEKIDNKEDWILAGIYADEGASGTVKKKRNGFLKMIQACEDGKIDLILTKSISRFARNTVDLLTTIRNLKSKNIAVYFEKEGINTLEGSGELLITILSSQAHEESRNISENCHWGIVRKFESGTVIVNHSKFLGYTKDKDGNLVIVPEEAELVHRIFRLFLEGNSSYKIKRMLEADGVKTVTGHTVWSATVIDKMLANEKYMGDALMQKTYTVDFLTKKKVMNRGIVPQYYIEDNHEAIIPKELFHRVQEEKARRSAIYRPAAKKKGRAGQRQIQLQVCAVRHLRLRRVWPAIPQTGMVKVWAEMGGVALRQPIKIRLEAVQELPDYPGGYDTSGGHGGHQQRGGGSGLICAGVPRECYTHHR